MGIRQILVEMAVPTARSTKQAITRRSKAVAVRVGLLLAVFLALELPVWVSDTLLSKGGALRRE